MSLGGGGRRPAFFSSSGSRRCDGDRPREGRFQSSILAPRFSPFFALVFSFQIAGFFTGNGNGYFGYFAADSGQHLVWNTFFVQEKGQCNIGRNPRFFLARKNENLPPIDHDEVRRGRRTLEKKGRETEIQIDTTRVVRVGPTTRGEFHKTYVVINFLHCKVETEKCQM